MYAAVFKIDGWGKDYFEGANPTAIMKKFEVKQDLGCLCRMGLMRETDKENLNSLKKLEIFLDKYNSGKITIKDIEKLEIKTMMGTIKCLGVASNSDEIEILKKNYPEALSK